MYFDDGEYYGPISEEWMPLDEFVDTYTENLIDETIN